MNAASAESGIEKNTATVARMLPRKTRIMMDVSSSPMPPSCSSVSMAVLTNTDWSNTTLADQLLRNVDQVRHRFPHAVHHRDGIGVAALLEDRQVDRPLAVHAHDVHLNLLRVLGVSDVATRTGDWPTILIGRSLIWLTVSSWLLV